MTTPETTPVTVREQIEVTLCDMVALAERNHLQRGYVTAVVDWAQRLTLRGLTTDWAREAQELYQEADEAQREGTLVARAYAGVCRDRADMYTQAAALLHQEVERRWPRDGSPATVTPCDGDGA